MAKYLIPDTVKEGFESILYLNPNEIALILEKMKDFKVGESPTDFSKLMYEVNIPDIEEIAKTIFSFSGLLASHKGDVKELAQNLVNTFIVDNEDEIEISNLDEVINNLVLIFNNSSALKASYEAFEIASDVSNALLGTSIVTDIRVVFTEDLEETKRNAVINQQIKIRYYQNTKRRELFFNVDRDDLVKLKDQIESALQKEELIVRDYSSMLHFVDFKE